MIEGEVTTEGRASKQDPREVPFKVNPGDLSRDAVDALVREYVLNEMTNDDETGADEFHEQALEALNKGQLQIWYTPEINQVAVVRV